jgi:predicted Rossmann-fold nucleotide-binding protein
MLTWNQLSIHDKKLYILNSGGFYDHLINHLNRLHEKGFLYDLLWQRIRHCNSPQVLVEKLMDDLS